MKLYSGNIIFQRDGKWYRWDWILKPVPAPLVQNMYSVQVIEMPYGEARLVRIETEITESQAQEILLGKHCQLNE